MTNPHNMPASETIDSVPGDREAVGSAPVPVNREPVVAALASTNPQQRLQAALSIGTAAEDRHLGALIDRCGVEPDFFVRDMLTWAITRMPAEEALPLLLTELRSEVPQAQSQALHTLSKIGDPRGWEAMDPALIGDWLIAHTDTEVARSAWRAGVVLVPGEERESFASSLITQLGRGDIETQKSLSRAIVSLGEDLVSVLDERLQSEDDTVRAHAMATRDMFDDPDAGFAHALDAAKRVLALGSGATA